MSSIIKSLSDVFTSLLELVWSFFTTAGDLVQETASFVLKFCSEIIDLFVNFFKGLVDLAGGIVGFVLGKLPLHFITMVMLIDNRQRPHARCSRSGRLWFLAVPAQPGQHCQGWQQETQLAVPLGPNTRLANQKALCSFPSQYLPEFV